MEFIARILGIGALALCWPVSLDAQRSEGLPAFDQPIERAYGSVALVAVSAAPGQTAERIGSAVVVRPNDVLLTAYHVVKDAYSVQVRFKSGEVFDQVQLLGVDSRRDVAAIKIIAGARLYVRLGFPLRIEASEHHDSSSIRQRNRPVLRCRGSRQRCFRICKNPQALSVSGGFAQERLKAGGTRRAVALMQAVRPNRRPS